MQLTIGLKDNVQKIQLDVDMDAAALQEMFEQVLNSPRTPLVLKDTKDRVTMINPAMLAWVQIGEATDRKVGFGLV